MISGLTGNTYEERLKELKLEKLQDRRVRLDLIQTFKILNGFDKVQSELWFQTVGARNGRTTRLNDHDHNLVRRSVSHTDIRNNFFSQRVINSWNKLPSWVKDSKTVKQFKDNYFSYTDALTAS